MHKIGQWILLSNIPNGFGRWGVLRSERKWQNPLFATCKLQVGRTLGYETATILLKVLETFRNLLLSRFQLFNLKFDRRKFPFPKLSLFNLLEHQRNLFNATIYEVQRSVPVIGYFLVRIEIEPNWARSIRGLFWITINFPSPLSQKSTSWMFPWVSCELVADC
jgi:hypothetical protein